MIRRCSGFSEVQIIVQIVFLIQEEFIVLLRGRDGAFVHNLADYFVVVSIVNVFLEKLLTGQLLGDHQARHFRIKEILL